MGISNNKSIWITWENQVRNKSMSTLLGADLFIINISGNRFTRYIICSISTIIVLFKTRPQVVFTQNPSICLNYLLILFKRLFKYKLVSDAHFAGVSHPNRLFQKLLDHCNMLVDLVIVTNDDHAKYIESIGGKSVVCEDPLPDICKYKCSDAEEDKSVFYICSYDIDEPYINAFYAAEILTRKGYTFYATGNFRKVNVNPKEFPAVQFLGYLPEEEFYLKLFKCSIVMDLTENDNCLLCGAYESMQAEKPLVTSDKKALRKYFTAGTIFTCHDVGDIQNAIINAYEKRKTMTNEIILWKEQIIIHQNDRINRIKEILTITE